MTVTGAAASDGGWWRERRPSAGVLHLDTAAAGSVFRAPRDMTEPLLRISPHVDCPPEDLARLRRALLALD